MMTGMVEIDILEPKLLEVMYQALVKTNYSVDSSLSFLHSAVCIMQSDSLTKYFEPVMQKIVNTEREKPLSRKERRKLYQILYTAHVLYDNSSYAELREEMKPSVLQNQVEVRPGVDYDSSDSQMDIAKLLSKMTAVQSEVVIDDFYKVDILLADYNMVVEVNGAHHYNGRAQFNKRS